MGKRILSLLLCLLMFGACLAGCSKKDDDIDNITEEGSAKTATIAMHLMSESKVSDEQAAEIQNAVNKITKSKFKTQLVLHFYTEDEYYVALEKAYADKKNAGKDQSGAAAGDAEGAVTEEETFLDEHGVAQLKYPTIPDYQVDIFYLGGYDKLTEYIKKDMLTELSAQVENYKNIKSFMTPGYLEGVNALCNGIYGIPANEPVGEYTYMLLNKDIIKKYSHVARDFDSLLGSRTAGLLDIVKKYEPDYVPLRSFTDSGELEIANFGFFGIDASGNFNDTEFSILGGSYDPNWKYLVEGQYIPCKNVFESETFTTSLRTLIDYKTKGYYGTEADANKDFAVGYIKGGIELIEEYSDKYEVVVLETPTVRPEHLFNNMFAISSFTSDADRSMQIISYLYTNSDFRNLLLYGIEGTNYELENSEMKDANGDLYKVVKRLNENYMMAPEKTGNVLLAIPTVDQAPNLRELYKQQNLDSTISLTLGFSAKYKNLVLSEFHVNYVRDKSKEIINKIKSFETVEEFDTYIEDLKKSLSADMIFTAILSGATIEDPIDPTNGPRTHTILSLYNTWLKDKKLVK